MSESALHFSLKRKPNTETERAMDRRTNLDDSTREITVGHFVVEVDCKRRYSFSRVFLERERVFLFCSILFF